MGGILSLEPAEIENRIHPQALEHFRKFQADVRFEVPLEELTEADLNAYLKDWEKPKFQDYMNEIKYWLGTCIDIGDVDSTVNQTKILLFKLHTTIPMFQVRSLLRRVSDRKLEKGREEARRQAEEARKKRQQEEERERQQAAVVEAERKRREQEELWDAAYKALNTPVDDAKKYLDNEEYKKYIKSINGAVLAYMEKREAYKGDSRSGDYRHWLWVINYGKEVERQQIVAILAERGYNQRVNEERVRVKKLLFSKQKDIGIYFKNTGKDTRYKGENFVWILSNEDKENFDRTIRKRGRSRFEKLVDSEFWDFFDVECYRTFFPLPLADYRLQGVVPCLRFIFEVFAVVEIRVWFKPRSKKELEFVGYDYLLLRPKELGGYLPFETIPLGLFNWLLKGGTKPVGVTISAASDGMISYKIANFKEEVTIPDKFADCLRNIGSFDDLINMGWVNEKVANIVGNQLGESKVEQEITLQKDKIERKDTAKARVFRLFDEGKRPSDREVKATKLKPQILYRYYQEWKRLSTN